MGNDLCSPCVIFDFGRVLVEFDYAIITAPYCTPEEAETIIPVLFDRALWDPLDAGEITDEALKAAVCARLPQHLHAAACAAYDHWPEHLPEIAGMRALLRDLRAAGRRIYLLSNISIGFAERWRQVPALCSLLGMCDGLVFSGPLHLTKPSRAIFEHLLTAYGLAADDCVFIDDSEKNIAGAEAAGIRGWLFDRDVPRLRRALLGKDECDV